MKDKFNFDDKIARMKEYKTAFQAQIGPFGEERRKYKLEGKTEDEIKDFEFDS